MDSHNDTAVAEPEAPAVESLPDASTEPGSFTDAIDQALANLANAPEVASREPEPTPAPEPEPEPEEVAKSLKEDTGDTKEESGEKTEEGDPIEALTEDIGDDWTPKASLRFKELKNELKSNRSELDQMRQTVKEQEAKLKELSGFADENDVTKLKEKIAEYEQEKTFNNLEHTTAYKEAVAEPLTALMDKATSIADKYDIDADQLIDAIALTDVDKQDNMLADLLDGASDRDRAAIYRVVEDIAPILDRRTELINNAEEALREAELLEEQRQNSEKAELAELRTNVTRNVVKRVTEKLPFLNGVEGLDLDGVRDKAASVDPEVVHPVDFAYNAVSAQLLPVLVKEFLTSRKENELLMDRLATYEEAEPTMSGTPAADGTKRASADLGFAEAIEAALGG